MKNKLLTLLAVHLGLAAVLAQPVITNQPQNQTNIAGATAMFTVGATGVPPLSYQWRSHASGTSFTNIPFGTEATLVLTNVQPTQRRFAVVVSDAGGLSATSSPLAQLTVLLPPSITQQPVGQSAEVGDDVAFSVRATGTAPLSFQWLFNGQTLAGQTRSNLTLTNVELSNASAYSVVITNSWGSITSQVATITVSLGTGTFTQITSGAIVNDGGHSIGCAWGDYDNDGFIDLFVTNSDGRPGNGLPGNFLYHNAGDGTFVRITTAGVTTNDLADWRGGVWADYDNDGFMDLYITSTDADGAVSRNILFRNNGNGTFTSMSSAVVGSIAIGGGGSEGAVWSDYDNDGALDMFISRFGVDWLFQNNGLGFFTSVTNDLAGTALGNGYYGTWADYNSDGLPDLFVTETGVYPPGPAPTNRLYRNLGGGTFEQVQSGSIATDRAYSFGSAWADYDNDGWLDLYVANGFAHALQTNYLYHNNGDGMFTRMTSNLVGSLVSDLGYSASPTWGDYDNDGYLDLFVTYGFGDANVPHTITVGNTNMLYHNNGDGSFTRVMTGRIASGHGQSICAAWGDYDNDGFLDLFIARGGHETENNYLYHNNGNSNAWIRIKLIGTVSNRSVIGAKVRLKATIGGNTFWQLREITVGNGFNQSPLEAHFGLGDATNIDTVRIEWPSGTVQELQNVAPRQFLTITEPPRLLAGKTNGEPQFAIKGGRGFNYQINTSTNLATWSPLGIVTITNLNGTARIIDTNAPGVKSRFYRAVMP